MIFDFLSYDFMKYAMVLGLAIGLAAALLSPFLVLNRQSMIADGLSHVAFTGIIFGLLFSEQPIYFAIPFAVVAACLITFLGQIKRIEYDSAIGVVASFSLAVGLITVSLSEGFSRSIESLLVGTILTVTLAEVIISLALLGLALGFVLLLYRPLLSMTYDAEYAKFTGVRHSLLKYCLAALTAVLIVIGVRTVGMLLMSAFVIFPALIASQLASSFKSTFMIGCATALVTVFCGITIAYHLDIPTGSAIVVLYTLLLAASIAFRKIKRRS